MGAHQSCPKGISAPPSFFYTMALIPNGCVLIARKVQENKMWDKPAWWLKVFCYLIMEVSFKDKKNKRGSAFFKYKDIYKDCNLDREGIKPETIDNLVRWMRKEGICTTQKTTRGINITICNYNTYQNITNYKNDSINEMKTRQKRDRNETITKECNNGINGNNDKEIDFSLYPFLNNKEFKDSWDDWLEVRKKLKVPATKRAFTIALNKLHKQPLETAVDMLEQAIERGWKGIYPLQESKKQEKGGREKWLQENS